MLISATSGVGGQDASLGGLSLYGIESGWMILGERSVADPGCGWSGDK